MVQWLSAWLTSPGFGGAAALVAAMIGIWIAAENRKAAKVAQREQADAGQWWDTYTSLQESRPDELTAEWVAKMVLLRDHAEQMPYLQGLAYRLITHDLVKVDAAADGEDEGA